MARFEYKRYRMGVIARALFYAPDEAAAEAAATALFHRIEQLDQVASDYRPASELMLLCRKAGTGPVPVSHDLFVLLSRSCEVARISNGAFDPTVGPFVALWRKARKTGQMPDPAELAEARKLVGWQKIRLDPTRQTAELLVPGMKLDLGGIAKGYAMDEAMAALRQRGITRALVEAGGDIVVGDPPLDAPTWNIELIPDAPDSPPKTISLVNRAISTSGDTEQSFVFNGTRYSHIVDPRTGLGMTTRFLATIIGPDGLTTDSLSTAASVLGPPGVEALKKAYPGTEILVRKAW